MNLELFEEVTCRAGDVNSAWRAALAVLDALDDAGGFGTLGAICALVGVHDLLTVAGLGNLRHNACSPWYECFGSRAGYLIVTVLADAQYRRHPGTSRKDRRDEPRLKSEKNCGCGSLKSLHE
jgi:hypothetical protein